VQHIGFWAGPAILCGRARPAPGVAGLPENMEGVLSAPAAPSPRAG